MAEDKLDPPEYDEAYRSIAIAFTSQVSSLIHYVKATHVRKVRSTLQLTASQFFFFF